MIKKILDNAKLWHKENEHILNISFFICGFFFDLLTLGRIDDSLNIFIQGIYIIFSYLLLISFKQELNFNNKILSLILDYRTEIFHFLIGSLLSAFTIFYFKSASFSTSFLFLFVIVFLLLVNELDLVKNLGLTMKSILLKICTVSFLIYLLPVALSTNSSFIFYLALLLATLITFLIKYIFKIKMNINEDEINKEFLFPRLAVVVVFFFLYVFNILPPLPLSLSHIGIYHKVEKNYPIYSLYHEKPWYEFWNTADENFKAQVDDNIYAFFRIFSPGNFKGKVWVEWYHFNEEEGEWKRSDRVPVSIEGGRAEGFRGFISKSNYTYGEWKVIIKTDNNLTLGTTNFIISKSDKTEIRNFKKVVDK